MTIFHRLAVITLSLLAFGVMAEDQSPLTDPSDWLYVTQGDGFVANIPSQTSNDLLSQVQQFRTLLKNKKIKCQEDVANSHFDAKDALITLIMPGGLIWAASKKQRNSQAKAELRKVTGQINELETDLAMLKATSSRQTLALLQ